MRRVRCLTSSIWAKDQYAGRSGMERECHIRLFLCTLGKTKSSGPLFAYVYNTNFSRILRPVNEYYYGVIIYIKLYHFIYDFIIKKYDITFLIYTVKILRLDILKVTLELDICRGDSIRATQQLDVGLDLTHYTSRGEDA